MRKEDVKIGMKVIDRYGEVITIVRHHIADPEKVCGIDRGGTYVADMYIYDLEPYEEPKLIEKLDDGGYVINLDKLGKGNYTSEEMLDIVYESLQVSENLPITQEFIESFGFAKDKSYDSIERYLKIINQSRVEMRVYESEYSLVEFGHTNDHYVFTSYACTTQSELRFLLTKGRIDCSK